MKSWGIYNGSFAQRALDAFMGHHGDRVHARGVWFGRRGIFWLRRFNSSTQVEHRPDEVDRQIIDPDLLEAGLNKLERAVLEGGDELGHYQNLVEEALENINAALEPRS